MNSMCPARLHSAGIESPLPGDARSWIDLQTKPPRDPRDLIAWANIAGATTAFARNNSYFSETWVASPLEIDPLLPACVALGTDSQQKIADAAQWNFEHLTARVDSATAPPLRKLLFLRAGTEWLNLIPIDLVGGEIYNDLQLSFLENAATRGDCQGTVPAVTFTGGNLTERITLEVVLKRAGRYTMGLRAVDSGNNVSMFEMEWVVVD